MFRIYLYVKLLPASAGTICRTCFWLSAALYAVSKCSLCIGVASDVWRCILWPVLHNCNLGDVLTHSLETGGEKYMAIIRIMTRPVKEDCFQSRMNPKAPRTRRLNLQAD